VEWEDSLDDLAGRLKAMKLGEALALAEKIEAVVESVEDLEIGEEVEAPTVRFKIHGRSYAWAEGKIKRTK
jgi:predicted DNA-binding protein